MSLYVRLYYNIHVDVNCFCYDWLTSLHVKWVCSVLSRIRELSAARIGTLLRISGQVVRTHPVHPELVSGTFLCLDCQSVIKDVEQQFKYTQPTICKNPVCANRRRFMLDTNKSRFVDFQKVRMWWIVFFFIYFF